MALIKEFTRDNVLKACGNGKGTTWVTMAWRKGLKAYGDGDGVQGMDLFDLHNFQQDLMRNKACKGIARRICRSSFWPSGCKSIRSWGMEIHCEAGSGYC